MPICQLFKLSFNTLDSPMTNIDPMGDWPVRLLHVSSLESLEWKPGNMYGSFKEPRYAILSYTWGRWEQPEDQTPRYPTLQVSGTNWEVPAIDPILFTPTEFERVLRKASEMASCDLIWVDIACINQTVDSPEKAKEIGRQARIFRNADQAFIWLLSEQKEPSHSSAPYEQSHRDLFRLLERSSLRAEASYQNWLSGNTVLKPGGDDESAEKEELSFNTMAFDWIADATKSISLLTQIPWFSSLWTLQEAFLKPDSIFLDREGSKVLSEKGDVFTLQYMLAFCKQLHQAMSIAMLPLAMKGVRDTVVVMQRVLVNKIQDAGLEALADRDRLTLYKCAHLRKAKDPLDKIYGIMQVWDFQLGKSAPVVDAARKWTLEELELDLGKQLVSRFPVESQLHLHMLAPKSQLWRQSWRISGRSVTPQHGLSMSASGHIDGLVDRHSSQLGIRRAKGIVYGHFKGKSCPFETLRQACVCISDSKSQGTARWKGSYPSAVRISLDGSAVLNHIILPVKYSLQFVPDDKQLELADAISALFGNLDRNLSVFLLGTVTQQKQGTHMQVGIGLIGMNAPDTVIGGWQKRLGICFWDIPPISLTDEESFRNAAGVLSGISSSWGDIECLFG